MSPIGRRPEATTPLGESAMFRRASNTIDHSANDGTIKGKKLRHDSALRRETECSAKQHGLQSSKQIEIKSNAGQNTEEDGVSGTKFFGKTKASVLLDGREEQQSTKQENNMNEPWDLFAKEGLGSEEIIFSEDDLSINSLVLAHVGKVIDSMTTSSEIQHPSKRQDEKNNAKQAASKTEEFDVTLSAAEVENLSSIIDSVAAKKATTATIHSSTSRSKHLLLSDQVSDALDTDILKQVENVIDSLQFSGSKDSKASEKQNQGSEHVDVKSDSELLRQVENVIDSLQRPGDTYQESSKEGDIAFVDFDVTSDSEILRQVENVIDSLQLPVAAQCTPSVNAKQGISNSDTDKANDSEILKQVENAIDSLHLTDSPRQESNFQFDLLELECSVRVDDFVATSSPSNDSCSSEACRSIPSTEASPSVRVEMNKSKTENDDLGEERIASDEVLEEENIEDNVNHDDGGCIVSENKSEVINGPKKGKRANEEEETMSEAKNALESLACEIAADGSVNETSFEAMEDTNTLSLGSDDAKSLKDCSSEDQEDQVSITTDQSPSVTSPSNAVQSDDLAEVTEEKETIQSKEDSATAYVVFTTLVETKLNTDEDTANSESEKLVEIRKIEDIIQSGKSSIDDFHTPSNECSNAVDLKTINSSVWRSDDLVKELSEIGKISVSSTTNVANTTNIEEKTKYLTDSEESAGTLQKEPTLVAEATEADTEEKIVEAVAEKDFINQSNEVSSPPIKSVSIPIPSIESKCNVDDATSNNDSSIRNTDSAAPVAKYSVWRSDDMLKELSDIGKMHPFSYHEVVDADKLKALKEKTHQKPKLVPTKEEEEHSIQSEKEGDGETESTRGGTHRTDDDAVQHIGNDVSSETSDLEADVTNDGSMNGLEGEKCNESEQNEKVIIEGNVLLRQHDIYNDDHSADSFDEESYDRYDFITHPETETELEAFIDTMNPYIQAHTRLLQQHYQRKKAGGQRTADGSFSDDDDDESNGHGEDDDEIETFLKRVNRKRLVTAAEEDENNDGNSFVYQTAETKRETHPTDLHWQMELFSGQGSFSPEWSAAAQKIKCFIDDLHLMDIQMGKYVMPTSHEGRTIEPCNDETENDNILCNDKNGEAESSITGADDANINEEEPNAVIDSESVAETAIAQDAQEVIACTQPRKDDTANETGSGELPEAICSIGREDNEQSDHESTMSSSSYGSFEIPSDIPLEEAFLNHASKLVASGTIPDPIETEDLLSKAEIYNLDIDVVFQIMKIFEDAAEQRIVRPLPKLDSFYTTGYVIAIQEALTKFESSDMTGTLGVIEKKGYAPRPLIVDVLHLTTSTKDAMFDVTGALEATSDDDSFISLGHGRKNIDTDFDIKKLTFFGPRSSKSVSETDESESLSDDIDAVMDAKYGNMEEVDESNQIDGFIRRFIALKEGGHFPDANIKQIGLPDSVISFEDDNSNENDIIEVDAVHGFVNKNFSLASANDEIYEEVGGVIEEEVSFFNKNFSFASGNDEIYEEVGSVIEEEVSEADINYIVPKKKSARDEAIEDYYKQFAKQPKEPLDSKRSLLSFVAHTKLQGSKGAAKGKAGKEHNTKEENERDAAPPIIINDEERKQFEGLTKKLDDDIRSALKKPTVPTKTDTTTDLAKKNAQFEGLMNIHVKFAVVDQINKMEEAISKREELERHILMQKHGLAAPDVGGVVHGRQNAKTGNELSLKERFALCKRPWEMSLKERTKKHPGYKGVDKISLRRTMSFMPRTERRFKQVTWEDRDVSQKFFDEKLLENSTIWFGRIVKSKGHEKVRGKPCQHPKAVKLFWSTVPEPGTWEVDWYTSWLNFKKNPNNLVISQNCQEQNLSGQEGDEVPRVGILTTVRVKPGERMSRVHYEHTSNLRHSRWRKRWYPEGRMFPIV